MSRSPMVFLDLDRTLFQTDMTEEIWRELALLYEKLSVDQLKGEYHRYVTQHSPLLRSYDLSRQLKDCGVDPSEAYQKLLATPLTDGRFEFSGVEQLIEGIRETGACPAVLTFGPPEYQRFKYDLCPHLRGVELITTLEHKANFLATQGECWLVDDRPLQDELPVSVHFIQVELEGKTLTNPNVITSLTAVKEQLIHELH